MGRRLILWRPKALTRRPYAVLIRVSSGYSPPKGRLPTCYSPVRRSPKGARLACVRPAASVRSEPGSNSPVRSHSLFLIESAPRKAPIHRNRRRFNLPDASGRSTTHPSACISKTQPKTIRFRPSVAMTTAPQRYAPSRNPHRLTGEDSPSSHLGKISRGWQTTKADGGLPPPAFARYRAVPPTASADRDPRSSIQTIQLLPDPGSAPSAART